MSNRDDFSRSVKDTLARRAGGKCSICRRNTSGPHDDPAKATNIGVAAHITAASPAGPRYDPSLSPADRVSIRNAIWLDHNCAHMIDTDPAKFTIDILRNYKDGAENDARRNIAQNLANFDTVTGRSLHSYLDAFCDLLSDLLRSELRLFFLETSSLGEETPDNEDAFIELRRSFLSDNPNALRELFDAANAYQLEPNNLASFVVIHQVAKIFIEKRFENTLKLLLPLHDAIQGLDDVVRRNNKNLITSLLDGIGEAARFAGDYPLAKTAYEQARDLSPKNHFVLKHLGTIYRLEKDFDKATKAFGQALAAKETYHVRFSLGYLHSDAGQYDQAREHYDKCVELLNDNDIRTFYRVYLKKAYVSLLQNAPEHAEPDLRQTLTSLKLCSPDGFVAISRFAANLLLSLLVNDPTAQHAHIVACEDYIRKNIDLLSHAVFNCVYPDLETLLVARHSALPHLIDRIRNQHPATVRAFDHIMQMLRLKHAQFVRQDSHRRIVEFGWSDREIVVFVKELGEHSDAVLSSVRHFHRVQRGPKDAPYSLRLAFEVIADEPTSALQALAPHLATLIDHSALVALLKTETSRFVFEPSLWQPFSALVSESVHRLVFDGHCACPDQRDGNRLFRVFSRKLIGTDPSVDARRAFINPTVGCSMGCSFCYLPQYGIRIDHSRDNLHRSSVDPQQLIQALEYSEWFRRGRDGTLLSIGSFTDPFLNKEWTIQLLRLVRSLKNPTQIATRVFPGDEAILEIERIFAGRPDQLMINLSINEDTAATRTFMRRWLAFADELNLTLYVKPYLDKTGECLQWFTDLALKHPSLSIVVGSLYFGDKIHLTRDDVLKTHRFCRDLVSPVVPQPTTPGMRNVHEEQFRHDLSKAISRVVFRTSSCALSAKLEIPDPLKNVGTSFCVGTDCANYERCGAQTVT